MKVVVSAPARELVDRRGGGPVGELLHDHVRVEERELFKKIERIVAAELAG
jgi:hypothetical protein